MQRTRMLVWLCVAEACALGAAAATFTNQVSEHSACDWEMEDGVPSDTITAVTQARDGYFWLATKEGLVRFDGVRFVVMDEALFPPMRDHSFTALCEGRDGTLWVASADGSVRGVRKGRAFELPLPAAATSGLLTRLFESADGSLWIGTETNGVIRFKDGQVFRFTSKDGLAHNSIRSFCEDDEGCIWIATAGGVSRWKDGRFTRLTVEDGLLHNSTRVVYFDRQRNLWIASYLGLTRVQAGIMTHYRKREGLADNLITAIYEDRAGALWIGTFNGLNRMVEGRLFLETRDDGTSYDRVNSLFEDQEGSFWVGTRSCLSRLKPRVVTAYTEQQGLTYQNTSSVMEDSQGNLWIGFWGGGINKVRDGCVTAYTRRERLSSDLVLTMHERRDGSLWFGLDYDGGLNLLEGNSFRHYRELEGLTDHALKAIQEDRRGNLWLGTRTGLVCFRDNLFHRYTTADGLPSDSIEAIYEDRAGRLWFGTEGGLAMLQDGKFVSFTTQDGLSHNIITSIHEDGEGTLWLGTHGGLSRLREGRFTAYTTRDGLFHDQIYAVVEDDLGCLWMSSRQGIFRVSKGELNALGRGGSGPVACVSFGKKDGMASSECKGSGRTAAWKGRDDRLWFATRRGVVAINPRAARVNPLPPRVLLEELQVNGQPADLSRAVKLVARQQELVFRYTAFGFSAPEKLAFKYKLEGCDRDWINAGASRTARYNHLPAGQYQFRLIAANGDGIWNREGCELALVLTPPFWQTWWFRSLLSLLAVGMVAAVVRFVSVQKLHRQLAALEAQHAIERERARIARDMHDDLGANLTQITILGELAKRDADQPKRVVVHADAICNTARELVQSMDEIVWSANPGNDNLRRLAGYIFQYAENFLAATSIRGRFEHPLSLPDQPLSAEVRHNLFLVVKEALNNAVRHSQGNEVWLRLLASDSGLELRIEDNGKGFDPTAGHAFGNGLGSMQKRIADLAGHFDVQSVPGAGTQITVKLDFTPEAEAAGGLS